MFGIAKQLGIVELGRQAVLVQEYPIAPAAEDSIRVQDAIEVQKENDPVALCRVWIAPQDVNTPQGISLDACRNAS